MTEIFFSKTEENKDGTWTATIAEASRRDNGMRNIYRGADITCGKTFSGVIFSYNTSGIPVKLRIHPIKGFPCVGILHQIK